VGLPVGIANIITVRATGESVDIPVTLARGVNNIMLSVNDTTSLVVVSLPSFCPGALTADVFSTQNYSYITCLYPWAAYLYAAGAIMLAYLVFRIVWPILSAYFSYMNATRTVPVKIKNAEAARAAAAASIATVAAAWCGSGTMHDINYVKNGNQLTVSLNQQYSSSYPSCIGIKHGVDTIALCPQTSMMTVELNYDYEAMGCYNSQDSSYGQYFHEGRCGLAGSSYPCIQARDGRQDVPTISYYPRVTESVNHIGTCYSEFVEATPGFDTGASNVPTNGIPGCNSQYPMRNIFWNVVYPDETSTKYTFYTVGRVGVYDSLWSVCKNGVETTVHTNSIKSFLEGNSFTNVEVSTGVYDDTVYGRIAVSAGGVVYHNQHFPGFDIYVDNLPIVPGGPLPRETFLFNNQNDRWNAPDYYASSRELKRVALQFWNATWPQLRFRSTTNWSDANVRCPLTVLGAEQTGQCSCNGWNDPVCKLRVIKRECEPADISTWVWPSAVVGSSLGVTKLIAPTNLLPFLVINATSTRVDSPIVSSDACVNVTDVKLAPSYGEKPYLLVASYISGGPSQVTYYTQFEGGMVEVYNNTGNMTINVYSDSTVPDYFCAAVIGCATSPSCFAFDAPSYPSDNGNETDTDDSIIEPQPDCVGICGVIWPALGVSMGVVIPLLVFVFVVCCCRGARINYTKVGKS